MRAQLKYGFLLGLFTMTVGSISSYASCIGEPFAITFKESSRCKMKDSNVRRFVTLQGCRVMAKGEGDGSEGGPKQYRFEGVAILGSEAASFGTMDPVTHPNGPTQNFSVKGKMTYMTGPTHGTSVSASSEEIDGYAKMSVGGNSMYHLEDSVSLQNEHFCAVLVDY